MVKLNANVFLSFTVTGWLGHANTFMLKTFLAQGQKKLVDPSIGNYR